MKIHLYRSERSTWCGRQVTDVQCVTRDNSKVDCKTCIKANTVEQMKENSASYPTLTTLPQQ